MSEIIKRKVSESVKKQLHQNKIINVKHPFLTISVPYILIIVMDYLMNKDMK
jgi:hypothetical protein